MRFYAEMRMWNHKIFSYDNADQGKINRLADSREFDTLKSKKVPQSLEIGLFFCQIFIFII